MLNCRHMLVMGAMALLAGCSFSVNGGDDAASDQTNDAAATAAPATNAATETAPATASAEAAGEWRRVRLVGMTNGDNLYINIVPAAGGDEEQVLCIVDECRPWFDAGDLPASVQGSIVEVQIGTSEQLDGGGTVMDPNFPAITAIRQVGR